MYRNTAQQQVKPGFEIVGTSFRIFTAVAWTVIVAILSWVTISADVPTILRPLNLIIVIPLFWSDALPCGPSYVAACLFVPAVFCVWCWPLILRGSEVVPARSHVLFAIVASLSLLDVATAPLAIGYHGIGYVIGIGILSAVWWVSLGSLAYLAEQQPSFNRNLGYHLGLFAWLAWYGLPYVGELP